MTLADQIIRCNKNLTFKGKLPDKVGVMNPFVENEQALKISRVFYKTFYDDNNIRKIILGINPGRFGAGTTGIPFTDTKRLMDKCKIPFTGITTHEPSSVFVYELIDAYGGVNKFYGDFYITSLSPLGYVVQNKYDRKVNYNYYDSQEMISATEPFIVESLKTQLLLGFNTEKCYCLGTGKNFKYVQKLNKKFSFFKEIIPLEHPRYIMQYKSKDKDLYIQKYLDAFSQE